MDLVYDGSFEGLLSVIFHVYNEKIERPRIYRTSNYQPTMFNDSVEVPSNALHAERVLSSLKKKIGKQFYHFLYAAHNDRDAIENTLFDYVQYILAHTSKRSSDFSHPAVLKVAQYARSVNREKHRMEAFVRFRLTRDSIYFASIEPDFDVIPLIKRHFLERYGDQKWIIYDLKRNYGIHYNLDEVQPITLFFENGKPSILGTSMEIFTEEEAEFQNLWANYFKHTNIPSRKNMRLHLQHVPKRYWKYLSEKVIVV